MLVTENVLMCQLKVLYEIVTQKETYEFLYNPEMRYLHKSHSERLARQGAKGAICVTSD